MLALGSAGKLISVRHAEHCTICGIVETGRSQYVVMLLLVQVTRHLLLAIRGDRIAVLTSLWPVIDNHSESLTQTLCTEA